MRHLAFALLVFLSPSLVAGQPLGVTTIRKGNDFKFPIVSSPTKSYAASRINRFLQLSELYSIAKAPYTSSIFDQAQINDGSIYGGKHSVVATIYSNNGGIFSTGVSSSACGATCTWWTKYYTFNVANGDRIELQDLFSTSGYQTFMKLAIEKRARKYRREVEKKVELEHQGAYLETLPCLANDQTPDFYITDSSLTLDGERCLTKGQKFDGLDMRVTFKLAEVRSYLNPYGNAVFDNRYSTLKRFRSSRLPQLFEGKVDGKYPIAMVLTYEFENRLWGMYAYLRYGKGLSLRGDATNGEISLTEYTLSPDVTSNELGEYQKVLENGRIRGKLSEGRFDGVWTDLENTRSLTFNGEQN